MNNIQTENVKLNVETAGGQNPSSTLSNSVENQVVLAEELSRTKRLEKRKTEIMSSFAHEARNQISGIIGLSEIILSNNLTDAVRDNVKLINSASESLLSLLNEVLDAAKIEAGKLELECVEFNMWKVMENLIKIYELRAKIKGVRLLCYVASEVPEVLYGDPSRFRQAIGNLLSNALKFTEKGEIVVKVGLNEKLRGGVHSQDNVELMISVSDTGIGIPIEKQPLLFDEFAQADSSVSRKFGGTGLGLFITKSIVEMMAGKIWLESVPGIGSRFNFTVCFKVAEFERSPFLDPADMVANSGKKQSARRILVADDNLVNRIILADALTELGHSVVCASNGREALDMLTARSYDLIFLDIQMPFMDGFETASAIRSGGVSRINIKVPIVGVTARAMKSDRERCVEAGMNAFLTKPLKITEIMSLINYLCEGDERAAGCGNSKKTAESVVIDIEKSLVRFGNNEERYYMACDSFKKSAPEMIKNMILEYGAAEYNALAHTARDLKTFARTIGAETLKEVLLHIEFAAGSVNERELGTLMPKLGREFKRVETVLSGLNK